MVIKTPNKDTIYPNIVTKSRQLTKVINFVIEKFCNSMSFNKPYFYQFFPYSDKQIPKMLNPLDDTKSLKIDDLFIVLDNLDSLHQKLILDYICQKYNGVFLQNIDLDNNNSSLEHLLLKITSTDGELSKSFLEAVEDENITKDEANKLNEVAYKLRSLLRIFEHRINKS